MVYSISKNAAIEILPYSSMADLAQKTVTDLQTGTVGISGGSTYRELCRSWSALKPDLSMSWFCSVDERVVPFDHPESNWGTVTPVLFKASDCLEQSYNHYGTKGYFLALLKNRFDGDPMVFDTLFLGVGTDGHTASLFPKTAALRNLEQYVLETKSPIGVEKRITMAPRMLIESHKVIMIISGTEKKQCIDWLVNRDESKPFVSILKSREMSTLYLDEQLYNYFLSLTAE